MYNSIIKTPANPNIQGVARISLLDLSTFKGLDIEALLLSPSLSLSEVEGSEVEGSEAEGSEAEGSEAGSLNQAITHFILPSASAYWDYTWDVAPSGLSYTHNISIDIPASSTDIHRWVALNERTSFAAYIVTNAGDVHLIGTEDLPCHYSGSRQVVGLNKYTFTFTCYSLCFPYPLYPESVPHFLTIP